MKKRKKVILMRKAKVLYWIWVLCWGKMLGVWWSMHWFNSQSLWFQKQDNQWLTFHQLRQSPESSEKCFSCYTTKLKYVCRIRRRNMSRVVNTEVLGETKLAISLSGPLNRQQFTSRACSRHAVSQQNVWKHGHRFYKGMYWKARKTGQIFANMKYFCNVPDQDNWYQK